jgi:Cu+-exporting ATPase
MTTTLVTIGTRPPAEPTADLDLALTGMTCAACARRIEKAINKVEGATGTVNFALETAKVYLSGPELTPQVVIDAIEAAGYGARDVTIRPEAPPAAPDAAEAIDPARTLRDRLTICGLLTLPVLLLAMVPVFQFTYWQWISLTLAAPVIVWGALPFHINAWKNLRHGAATMDTLISLGVIAAFAWSMWALLWGGAGMPGMTMTLKLIGEPGTNEIYLEVAAVLTTAILAGRYFEARAKRQSGAALRALLDLGAKDVAVLRGGTEVRLPVEQLAVGMRFVVRPGEKVATDGVIVEGMSAIDASLLTGESVPQEVTVGETVAGATVNVSGRIVVEATRVGADTHLAQITKLVTEAQNGKAAVQRLADKVAGVFVPIVIAIALATLATWLILGRDPEVAFSAAVAVLIIACPCALGLATPTALLVGTGRGAQLGILIKGPEVLETVRHIDTVVLDKTGTVTTGAMAVAAVVVADGLDQATFLRYTGSLESGSEHPVARAIVAEATTRGATIDPPSDFVAVAGRGVRGTIDGVVVVAGKPAWVIDEGYPLTAQLSEAVAEAERQGASTTVVGWDGTARGVLLVADQPKATSRQAIAEIKALGLKPILLTGDHAAAARAIGQSVGIDEVIADVLPAEKLAVIKRLQDGGARVAMVGDGINDAAALAQADLGLSMGTGTDAAIEASDLTLVRGDLRTVPDAIRLSAATLRTIKANLFWAFAYNAAAIPLAALGLLNPLIAGVAMALSSIFVVTNSLRLRRFKAGSAQ